MKGGTKNGYVCWRDARRFAIGATQSHKWVCRYGDSHITDGIFVADLCALADLSESQFSRVFTGTFGQRPHALVIRGRVKLAAQYTLRTEAPLRTEGRCA